MKYARALAEVAGESGTTEEVRADLEAFREAFQLHRELRDVLFNPTIPLVVKRDIVAALARRMNWNSSLVNFLFVVLEHSRLHLLDEFAEAYQEVLDERAGIARVKVKSSHALGQEEKKRLQKAMAALAGKDVKLTYTVDDTLLGGVVLQVGSTVYDGTIRSRLEELGRQLASAAS